MARGRMDLNHRPNTLEENKLILCELRSRNKIDYASPNRLEKFFARLNSKNAKGKEEKASTEHLYGPTEGFPPGSWWGIRMDCSRDRVHAPFDADIQDGPYGVASLCTRRSNTDNDVDLGDFLTFTGRKYGSETETADPLVRNYRDRVPLRLVRSYDLANEFAPKTGYRYDGLYTVAACWIGVSSESEKYYKFALARVRCREQTACRKSVGSRGEPAIRADNSNRRPARTRRRSSADLEDEPRRSANERERSKNASKRSETIKFSFEKAACVNGGNTEKAWPNSKRHAHDSAIVSRCVSKKVESAFGNSMVSVPYGESPVQNVNRVRETCTKPIPCKLQNTNISIRTDLYDSSHNLQQDPKKGTPMTFCRIFKSVRGPTRVLDRSNVASMNIDSSEPFSREDKIQESRMESRSTTRSPSSESSRSADRCAPKINGSANAPITSAESNASSDDRAANNGLVVDSAPLELDRREESIFREKQLEENFVDGSSNAVGKSWNETLVRETGNGNSKEIHRERDANMDVESSEEEEIFEEPHAALDSLTPDEMLNFIVKQKYHPTAKLLIGSVIGLATGESTILRTYESLISRNNRWNRNESVRIGQDDSKVSKNENDESVRNVAARDHECNRETHGKGGKSETSVAKSSTKKRASKDTKDRLIFKMRLRRTRVSKRLLGSEKKPNTKTVESWSQRLRNADVSDKSQPQQQQQQQQQQQPFSKSTIPKKRNGAKKRRSELANLVIDAKIGPKIRGPRNRRLRCTTHIFAKKRSASGSHDISTYLGGGDRSMVGMKGNKVSASVELPSKRGKRVNSVAKTRIPRSLYVGPEKRIRDAERIKNDENVKRENNTGKVQSTAMIDKTSSRTISPERSNKVEKRKVSSFRNSGAEPGSGIGGESTKRSCRHLRNDVKLRRIRMIDAATQCSVQKDVATSMDPEIGRSDRCERDQADALKIEWIDLDDVKSESRESGDEDVDDDDDDAEQQQQPRLDVLNEEHKHNRVRAAQEDERNRRKTSNADEKLSAFVPVDISDSDFRIARLRSIGFRPIEPACFPRNNDEERSSATGSSNDPSDDTTVVARRVDERYEKYTSEETSVVGYMDQELRYQDIEDEEAATIGKNRDAHSTEIREKNIARLRNKKMLNEKPSSVSVEEDSEIPWHGWKKFVKNKQAHWIGW